jgi:hypothetical protein
MLAQPQDGPQGMAFIDAYNVFFNIFIDMELKQASPAKVLWFQENLLDKHKGHLEEENLLICIHLLLGVGCILDCEAGLIQMAC